MKWQKQNDVKVHPEKDTSNGFILPPPPPNSPPPPKSTLPTADKKAVEQRPEKSTNNETLAEEEARDKVQKEASQKEVEAAHLAAAKEFDFTLPSN